MAIEISNAIHAMAVVTTDTSGKPIFVGQGNVGFAPFGIGPNFSEQLGPGRYRLHMLVPISMVTPRPELGRGEGMVLAGPLQAVGSDGPFPIVPPAFRVFVAVLGLFDILVETTSASPTSFAGVSGFDQISDDVTITPAPFADLLTAALLVPPGGTGVLEVLATVAAEATVSGSEVDYRLLFDGNPIGPGNANGASFTVASGGFTDFGKHSVSILKRFVAAPGGHTVKLQWRIVGPEATASIRVSSGFEHGSLRVVEQPTIASERDADIHTFQVVVLRFPQQSTAGG